MGKIKFDLETKIQACKEYEKGNKSFIEIAKEINAGDTTVASWYVKYKEKGEDNGPMEGFFGTLKAEMFYGKEFNSLEELKERIMNYIEFYNNERFQKRLNCMAPLEYREYAV
ncbi:IS3 family transposase [Ezakiella peruensis]|uniref:IS3 family transposase n=1 Tax=Ezakiella peruensis TaxID=1464038 RepID=UPI000C1B285C|nr:IS3 family transposase [Ezakiella peruensis]